MKHYKVVWTELDGSESEEATIYSSEEEAEKMAQFSIRRMTSRSRKYRIEERTDEHGKGIHD